MRFFFSTEHVREDDQFAYWRVVTSLAGMSLTPERDGSGPFRAWLRWRSFGGVTVAEANAPPHRLLRDGPHATHGASPEYMLVVGTDMAARYVAGDRELSVDEGEALLVHAGAWTIADYADGMRWGAIRIPHRLLPMRLVANQPLAIHFSRDPGLGALIVDYARNIVAGALGDAFDVPVDRGETEIVGHLCGLLSLAARDITDVVAPPRGAAGRLPAIEAYIDANCTDPTLSPATVAARFGISIRYLDKLFRRTGSSFTNTLMRRRLHVCCAMLADDAKRPIAEIARHAGFSSLTQFNRRFRTAYGVTPRAWRARQR